MNQINWFQVTIDLLQAIISGIFIGLMVYWLDEKRARRERRLADFRIAANWEVTNPKPSLRNFDLTEGNLSGYDLSNANLESAVLQKTKLWGTNLNGANLRTVNFRYAKLVGVTFTNVVAFYSDFSSALIRQLSESGKIFKPDFTNTNFRGTIFRKAIIKDTVFYNVNFVGADFSGAVLQDCNFTDSDLADAKFLNVKKIENCVWKNVKIGDAKKLPKWLLQEIQVQNAKPKNKK